MQQGPVPEYAADLAVFAKNIAPVTDHHSCVPDGLPMGFITLKYRVDDDHAVPLSICLQHRGGCSCFSRFSKLQPLPLPSAECKRHCPGFLQTQDLYSSTACCVHQLLHCCIQSLQAWRSICMSLQTCMHMLCPCWRFLQGQPQFAAGLTSVQGFCSELTMAFLQEASG